MSNFATGKRVRIVKGSVYWAGKTGTIDHADIDVIDFDWWVQLDDLEPNDLLPFKESEMRVIE